MLLTPDELKAIMVALGAAAAERDIMAKKAIAAGDLETAMLSSSYSAKCEQLGKALASNAQAVSGLGLVDREVITSALRLRAQFYFEQSEREKNSNEKKKREAFAAGFANLSDRIEKESGRATSLIKPH